MTTAMAPDNDELLLPTVVAEMLFTTTDGLAQWRHRGRGPKFIKAGARILYRRSDIRKFLDENTLQRTLTR